MWYVGMDLRGGGVGKALENVKKLQIEIQYESEYEEWRCKGKQVDQSQFRDFGSEYAKHYEHVCFGVVNVSGSCNYVVWTEKESQRNLRRFYYLQTQQHKRKR